MHFLVCIAGLPGEVVEAINKIPPGRLTEDKTNRPIIRRMKAPFEYRRGMEITFHQELADRIEQLCPSAEVGVALVYVRYSRGADKFAREFFPFGLAVPIEPAYLDSVSHYQRKAVVSDYAGRVEAAVIRTRKRVNIVRDALSGRNFSPLSLPLRNFRSEVFGKTLEQLFQELGTVDDARAAIEQSTNRILEFHRLVRAEDCRPYFEDDRGHLFKSPGRGEHGACRRLADGHRLSCLINSRTRLGGPLMTGFHYDCMPRWGKFDRTYPNCHDEGVKPHQNSHVNISPNDAIR